MKLAGQFALVTGASRGIGYAIALAYAQEGADVAITGRSAPELDELRGRIEGMGRRCLAITADLGARGGVDEVWSQVQSGFGRLDILVNNAGLGSASNPKPVADYDDDFWEASLYLNLTVPYLLSKRALQGMLARKSGRIIMVASINGKTPAIHASAYTASKHGLLGLTRAMALEVSRDGVTVNAICPGPVRTKMNNARVAYDAQRAGVSVPEFESGMTLLGRRLEPHEIAPMAVFLASAEAAVITGQSFNVDGGRLLSA
ncbi:MAG: SDR family oxidoreductase [Chloroflexi bacterium]|nr:SDR family oxidoreductase [Chloroflexota bacterium]